MTDSQQNSKLHLPQTKNFMKRTLLIVACLICLSPSKASLFKVNTIIPRVKQLKKEFKATFQGSSNKNKPNTFEDCLNSKLEAINDAAILADKFHNIDKYQMKEEVTVILDKMDSIHDQCHQVDIHDAKMFYNENQYLHECVDKIMNGVNKIRVKIASRPREHHGEIHLFEEVLEAFEEVFDSIEYCLDKFEIIDL